MSDETKFSGYRMASKCWCVTLPTTNATHNTAETKEFGYVTVRDGCLYIIGPTVSAVAALFPDATEVSLVGPALDPGASEGDHSLALDAAEA